MCNVHKKHKSTSRRENSAKHDTPQKRYLSFLLFSTSHHSDDGIHKEASQAESAEVVKTSAPATSKQVMFVFDKRDVVCGCHNVTCAMLVL